jgi:hypothetical protein
LNPHLFEDKLSWMNGQGVAVVRRIRVRKEDSAYVYALLEASEGIASYTTLPHKPGDPHRDMELQIPTAFQNDVDRLLGRLGDMVYDLDSR